MEKKLGSLVLSIPPIAAETSCADVYDRFVADPDLLSMAVVRGSTPVGLVNRHEFFPRMAHLFGRSLYDKRAITVLMDRHPLIVDVDTDLQALNHLIVAEKPAALLQGFIVTDQDRYLGVGTALSLLQLTNDHMNARAKDLEDARIEAEQANRAKSEFLANMSHELRTPLNAVLGFSDIIRSELLGPIGNPRYCEYAGDIAQSGTHLLDLISDLLDVAKIESGKMDLQESQVQIEETLRRSLRLVRERADDGDITVDTALPANLPDVRADDRKLQQVLVNILSNAVKFTPPGGSISITGDYAPDQGLRITIADTGIGIAPNDIAKVLEPFGQVENGLLRRYNGTGLGLPLAKAIIELHGGTLDLESRLSEGTTVTLVLPTARVAARAA